MSDRGAQAEDRDQDATADLATESATAERSPSSAKTANTALLRVTFYAVLVGLILGFAIHFAKPGDDVLKVMLLPGNILLRMLKALVVPLVFTSVITAITSMDLGTTLLASILGLILVVSIQPGSSTSNDSKPIGDRYCHGDKVDQDKNTIDAITDIFYEMFPENIFDAASDYADCHINILGLITCSVAIGCSIASLKEKGEPLLNVIVSLNDVVMKIVHVVIWYAPVGICFLLMYRISKEEDLTTLLSNLALYMVTVVLGLAIHAFVILPGLYTLLTKRPPFEVLRAAKPALVTAFGIDSSSATLPVTLDCAKDGLGLDETISLFVLPLGATLNMNGTALYEAVAAIFVAQTLGISLSFGKLLLVAFTASLAAVGAAGIPEAGLITLVMVVQAAGLPADGIGLILSVDWLLDRYGKRLELCKLCLSDIPPVWLVSESADG